MAQNQNFVNREELTNRAVMSLREKGVKISKSDANTLTTQFFVEMEGALVNNEQVNLTGYLQAGVKDVPARTKRNPKTGEEVQKPAGRKLVLKGKAKLHAAAQA